MKKMVSITLIINTILLFSSGSILAFEGGNNKGLAPFTEMNKISQTRELHAFGVSEIPADSSPEHRQSDFEAAYEEKMMQLRAEQSGNLQDNSPLILQKHTNGSPGAISLPAVTWRNGQTAEAGQWIFWGSGVQFNSIGGSDTPIDWNIAQRFSPEDIADFESFVLSQVNFFPADPATFTIRVWQGSESPTLIYSQEVESIEVNEMNTVVLDEPVSINTNEDLWIGYRVVATPPDGASLFPAAIDEGPAIIGKGDMISVSDGVWESLSDYGISGNWIIQGFVEPGFDSDAPAAPENLVAIAGDEGALEALITWNNPSFTADGEVLDEMDLISVFRNGELIHSLSNPVPGAFESFADLQIEANGIATYSVRGENPAGQGAAASTTVFVGEDVPAAPANVVLAASDDDALITWDAPVEGLNGEYFSGDNLQYELVRMPGNITVAQDISGNSFLDTTVPSPGNYFYRVTAVNQSGTGGTAQSNTALIGGEGLAFISIGDGDILLNLPYDFFWEHSLSQTLYYQEEIGVGGGLITAVEYNYQFNSGQPETPIKIWLGETDVNDLTDGWVDPSTLQLVFDGTLGFSAGLNTLNVEFDAPYMYQGGNLVVYSLKTDDQWLPGKSFLGTSDAGSNRSLLARRDFTPYDPVIPDEPGILFNSFPNITLQISTTNTGSVEGIVSDGNLPLEGVSVQRIGGSGTTTDANGFFQFPFVPEGNHSFIFNKFGYFEKILENVVVEEDIDAVLDVVMTALPSYMVAGTVEGNNEIPIEGAMVSLTGFSDYSTQTDASGEFVFPDVFEGIYKLTITAPGYTPFVDESLAVDEDILLDVVMDEILLNPGGLNIVLDYENPGDALFSWSTGAETEFRYDSGIPLGSLGTFDANYNVVLGAVHRNIAEIYDMSWMMPIDDNVELSETVKVWVFGLNEDGSPNQNDVLYSQENVPNLQGEWNAYTFSQPVSAPNGFLIGISAFGDLVIVVDMGLDPDWPFIPETQYFNFDVTGTAFTPIETAGFEWNFFIRANGSDLGTIGGASVANALNAALGYNVYLDDMDNPVAFTDNPEYLFTDLEEGNYTAGVRAVYASGLSELSAIDFEMAYPVAVNLNLSANSGQSPEGALVTLSNQEDDQFVFSGAAGSDGVVAFDMVPQGLYTLEISLENHQTYIDDQFVVEQDLSLDIVLDENTDEPVNLLVVTDGLEAGQALFSWNNPLTGWSESFEDGVLPEGWSQIITNDGFLGGQPTTWHITGPVGNIVPQQGDYQAYMMWNFTTQDEWLITPEFTAPAGDLTFWYHGTNGSTAGDNYFVKISTDGGNNWDILWNASELPFGQNFYQEPAVIDLSHYAGQTVQIAWRNEDGPSNNGMWYQWAIDNITIGDVEMDLKDLVVFNPNDDISGNTSDMNVNFAGIGRASQLAVNGFNVFLNGVMVSEGLSDTQFLFSQLNPGIHTAGVQAVYSSGVSEIVEKDFEVHAGNLLALVAQPVEGGSLQGAGWYPSGVDALVNALPADGYAFVNWTNTQGNVISEEPAFFFTMPDQDFILIANFSEFETFSLTFNIDMSDAQWLDMDEDMVNVTGSMHGWVVLGDNARDQALMRVADTYIYTITFQLPPGTYNYAYFMNEGEHDYDWEEVAMREVVLNGDKEIHDVWGMPTSLADVDPNDFSVYPNPFTDQISISGADWATRAIITDIMGNTVIEVLLNDNFLHVSGLRTGFYLLHLYGEQDRRAVRKVIRR